MLQGKISDISKGHKEIVQLTRGKDKEQLYVWSAEEARYGRKVRVTLLRSTAGWSLAEAGVYVLDVSQMKMLIKLKVFLVMPIPDDV